VSRTRAMPVPVKAARAIERALEGLSKEDRIEALTLAFPQDDPTTRHARYRMALEAIQIVTRNNGFYSRQVTGAIVEKGLGS
jgi:hypothetical protein